jgi:hypothetical protein
VEDGNVGERLEYEDIKKNSKFPTSRYLLSVIHPDLELSFVMEIWNRKTRWSVSWKK